jgi:integrase
MGTAEREEQRMARRKGQRPGWCHKERRANGKMVWRAGYRDTAGVKHQQTFAKEGDGWEWIGEELAKLGEVAAVGDLASSKEPLSVWWNESLGLRPLKPGTRRDVESVGRNWVLPYIGDIAIAAFSNVAVIDKWVARIRTDGCKEPTIHKAVAYLKPVLNLAVERNALARNAAARYTRARKPARKPIHVLDHRQVWDLADAIGERHRVLVLVLGYGGLRFGEAAALRVSDFNSKDGTLDVTKNVVDLGGNLIEQSTTKSGKPRTITLPPSIRTELMAHIRRERIATKPDAIVFPSLSGGFLSVNNFGRPNRALMKAARQVGLPAGFTIHWLRHTAASIAIAQGWTALEVCELLGHFAPSFTLDRYGHLLNRQSRSDRQAVAEAAIQAARFGEAENVVAMGGRS